MRKQIEEIAKRAEEAGYEGDFKERSKSIGEKLTAVEDELIQRFVPPWLRRRLKAAIANQIPGKNKIAHSALFYAQGAAQRLAFRQRKNVLKMDTWLEEALSFSGSGMRF